MSWPTWSLIWISSLAMTGIVVGLVFLLSWWALPLIFTSMFLGLGFVVTRD